MPVSWIRIVTALALLAGARPGTGLAGASTCDGLPAIDVETPAGFCLGVVADGFRFPRSVTALADGSLLVADMGGWVENRGTL